MRRCVVALDMQDFFKPSPGLVHHVNEMGQKYPMVATLFKHDELKVPLSKLGKTGPESDNCLVQAADIYEKNGFGIPETVVTWLGEKNADEVILCGGHTDANVLSAGFALFNAGFTPIMVPMLCYGNDWYMHTVTTGIWSQEIGKVFESTAELMME